MKHYKLFLDIADRFSKISHCVSHKVCCLAVRDDRILYSGINGTASGSTNCDEVFPSYDKTLHREAHHKWSLQNELHAEEAILTGCAKLGIKLDGADLYVNLQPCFNCCRLLMSSGVKNIIYRKSYDKANNDGIILLNKNNIQVYSEVELDTITESLRITQD